MRMPRRPRLARTTTLGAVAALASALVLVGSVQGAADSVARAAARAWQAVFGDRPAPAFERRMLVVLASPSLADRMTAATGKPSAEDQRRWTANAEAQQKLLLEALASRGISLKRELVFTRTVNGFSALLDPRAVSELDRTPGVAGIYPVRAVYPASVGTDTLARPEFGAGGGRRAEISLPGFDGSGVTVALLDTGVDRGHPYVRGRVLRGWDVVDGDRLAAAEAHPRDPGRLETHGTRMAGLVAGANGTSGLRGVAPGARLLPIRVLGWQPTGSGGYAVLGRGDQLIAGLERAVDPDADGDVEDAAAVALAAVVEPYAAFTDSPESRAVAGATTLGTLVVAPAGNDGRGGIGFGSIAAPGGAPHALAVGALDARRDVLETEVELVVGDDTEFEETTRVLSALGPRADLTLAVGGLFGPSLAHPDRAATVQSSGESLAEFFDRNGVSLVAGRAALVPAEGGSIESKARNASAAGAAALVVYGADAPAGALDLDEAAPLPVVALPSDAGEAAAEALAAGRPVTIFLGAAQRAPNPSYFRVSAFSSGGLAFDGGPKPDLVAPGVGLATADVGANADGSPRYATATGTSAAAAVTAGAASLLAQARPGLSAAELKSLLVGSASRLERNGEAPAPVTTQGAGLLDLAPAAAGELAVEPATLAFGRADEPGWTSTRTVRLRNLSSRPLEIGFGFAPDQPGEPPLEFAAEPARMSLEPEESDSVTFTVTATRELPGGASGTLVVAPEGARAVRMPWAIGVRENGSSGLVGSVGLSHWEFEPSRSAPAVLAFRAGRVVSGPRGETIEPVSVLDLELWTGEGKRLGVLARLRNLLPGRYAFGLTGRDPQGRVLDPGIYVLRLRAQPVDGGDGEPPSTAEAVFRITR
jgi:minor extracellular serine protease Vpr